MISIMNRILPCILAMFLFKQAYLHQLTKIEFVHPWLIGIFSAIRKPI